MLVRCLSTFILAGGRTTSEGEVVDLPTGTAIEAINLGYCVEASPDDVPDVVDIDSPPDIKPSKKKG